MSTTIRALTAASIAFVALTVASCSDEVDGAPSLPGGTSSAAAGTNPQVPQVQDPLDATPFLKNPCKLLDEKIVSEIGRFEPGDPDVNSDHAKNLFGPGCNWDGLDNHALDIDVTIETVRQEKAAEGLKGLDSVYDAKAEGNFDTLQPVQLAGHPGNPAAIAGVQEDISSGECPVYVGIDNDLIFSATVLDENNPANACPAAQKVATAVLDKLKKGA